MEKNIRNIVFGIIIIICIIAINFGVYWQFFRNNEQPTNTIDPAQVQEANLLELETNFKNIFDNTLDYQQYSVNTTGITKLDSVKDLVYTWVDTERIVENKYDIKLHIPKVNISNASVEKFNETIKSLYVDKANDIILNAVNNTIYTVEYMSYVNTNILSLVIKSTLKEGNNPQRVIIQTYNYNLSTNEEITFKQLLEIKELNANTVSNRIMEKVKHANEEAENLKKLGYNVFSRDLSSDIYDVENVTNFILGKDGYMYIIYPYGNSNYTDEMDVIAFK